MRGAGRSATATLDELYAESDIVTLHCPLTPQTHHLINDAALDRMKPGAMLINTSRGAVIDTRAVIEALKSGQLGSLGIDVYEEEENLFFQDLSDRVLQDDVLARLMTFPNVIVTGHQAFFTRDALEKIAATTRPISTTAAGRPCPTLVDPAARSPDGEVDDRRAIPCPPTPSATWDAVVVGAGAAGLVAAAAAAERGLRTLLVEKNRKPGVKILMSGGTRCNITQATDNRGIVAAFGPQGRFLHSALAALRRRARRSRMFEAEGVATKVEDTGKIFPASDKAADVLAALLRRLAAQRLRAGARRRRCSTSHRDDDGFRAAHRPAARCAAA